MRSTRSVKTDSSRRFRVLLCALLVVLSLVANPLRVYAQQPPVADAGTDTALQEGRTYFSPEPWEIFDLQSGDLRLFFTALVLPGNGGRDLRFVRSYSNQRGWALGIEGLVTQVAPKAYLPPAGGVLEETYGVYVKGGPLLFTWDGGERQTFYTQNPNQFDPATQRIVKTEDHAVYNRDTRTLYRKRSTNDVLNGRQRVA